MSPDQDSPVLSRRALRVAGLCAVIVIVAAVVLGLMSRHTADARLNEWTEDQAVPTVAVAKPDTHGDPTTIDLPGRLEAYSQAQIFARVSGYLKNWQADIGAPVKAGQLLAEIDAPDLDQQIMQARADLTSAQANAALSKTTLERGKSLIASGSISQQDLDQRIADYGNKAGLVNSAQANLDRLQVSENYKLITAPFDGLVTARTTDVGALINAGSSGGAALFVVSDVSKLRAYVNVPQNVVPRIRIGTEAEITVPEYPGKTFRATVEASAQSVDVASGTTRMQLIVDNPTGALMTGAFADIHLDVPAAADALYVPASALIFDEDGLHVATINSNNQIELKTITISRDLGREIEIASGLAADDRVVTTPPDGVESGDLVRLAASPTTAAASVATVSKGITHVQ